MALLLLAAVSGFSQSCAACDPDHDGGDNYPEYLADTNPANAVTPRKLQARP